MIALKNVLVATDFSEPSATALDYGRVLARTFGATLHLVHVVESIFVANDVMGGAYAGLPQALEEAARKQLDATLAEDDRRELNGRATLLASIGAATGIVQYAKDEGVDLIVLGTHGRSGWSHLLLGSVAEKVLRMAPCPVLTVRHPEREFIAPDSLVVTTKS